MKNSYYERKETLITCIEFYLISAISNKNIIILSKNRNSPVAEEYNYIMNCKMLTEARKIYIPSYYRHRPNVLKYHSHFFSRMLFVLNNLCKFISITNERVVSPGWICVDCVHIYICIMYVIRFLISYAMIYSLCWNFTTWEIKNLNLNLSSYFLYYTSLPSSYNSVSVVYLV